MGSILIVPKFFMFLIPNECKNEVSFSFFFDIGYLSLYFLLGVLHKKNVLPLILTNAVNQNEITRYLTRSYN